MFYRNKRRTLSLAQQASDQQKILAHLMQLSLEGIKVVQLYLPILHQIEIDTRPYLEWLAQHYPTVRIALSISYPDRNQMELVEFLTGMTFVENALGIPEPLEGLSVPFEEVDLLIMPLLAFDSLGNRLGYGKGYYDRMLTQCRPDVLKVGLSWFEAIQTPLPSNEWDVPLNKCITPSGIVSFANRFPV